MASEMPRPAEVARTADPWWVVTAHLLIVTVFGVVAVVARADAGLVLPIAVMACAALRWNGPWPSVTFGGKHDRDR